jgi:hypothetical protein
MGGVKQMMIEREENGYSLPDYGEKFLCTNHYDDNYINQFIIDHSKKGKCSYCGKKTKVADLHDFIELIAEHIKRYYGNPDDENLPLASSYLDRDDDDNKFIKRLGSYAVPQKTEVLESTSELLFEIDLYSGNDELNLDIENCFYSDTWVQHEPFVLSLGEELSWKWKQFEEMVKHKQRFTFFRIEGFDEDLYSNDNGLSDILTEISKLIKELQLVKPMKFSEIYRCRFTNEDPTTLSFEDITSAPDSIAKQSRMSPAGISMFYGAFDIKIAIEESKPKTIVDEKPVIGKFETTCDLNIIDLTELPIQSFWSPYNWQAVSFLHSFSKQVSNEIERDDRIHIEYVPTQIFTEYLRYIFPKNYNIKADGIIFKSSLKDVTGNNIVLFYDQESSIKILNLVQIITI